MRRVRIRKATRSLHRRSMPLRRWNIYALNVERVRKDNLKQCRYVAVYTDVSNLGDEFSDTD